MSEQHGGPAQLRAVPAGSGATATADAPEDAAPPADAAAPAPGNGLTAPQQRAGSRFISDVIVEMGFLPRDRVDTAIEEGKATGRAPEQVLLEGGAITGDQVARAVAQRFGLPHVDLTLFKTDVTALNSISAQAARRLDAVPVGFDDSGRLLVAMADPSNVLALDDLKLMAGTEVRPVVASPDDIAGLISRMSRLDNAVAEAVEQGEEELADVTEIRESADDAPVIKLVHSIIAQAVDEGASDIHFEPEGREMRVRFRVDGVLREITHIPHRMVAGTVSRVKIMADLDIAERRVPQDGRVSLTVEGHAIDTRVVSMPRVDGEGIVMRILDKSQALIGLDRLGMSEVSVELFEKGFRRAYGAVLVTGPTGSGKSTTLYAALNEINQPERNILTIEDPVEYQLAGVNQLQVNLKAGMTFAGGLRAMLRADPDVIMVGEIRDADTAKIAIESALTGHLVLSTLHTNDAPSAITRLTEMGIEPFLSASAIVAIVAQRLVRQLCTHCKRRIMLSTNSLKKAGFDVAFDLEAYEPVGCGRCGTSGYKGRTGLYEVMMISDEIRDLTVERASADDIRKAAVGQGMRPLRADGFEKVKNGITSIAEVARVT
ncbi:MAG TPA: ATPase, T2SS/T4P/T4SS family [Thermoleophilaceae bacterium]|jgi:type IV pilus assembly protein PilB|nr:ATPase, T2SS/T4P/T4SS family [Thermoleophilaceae bacterium]